MVIVGPTGAGKSSLAKALLGCDPRSEECPGFPVCGGVNSCTKNTTIGTGSFRGYGQPFTVVDTPGFDDSDNNDNELIDEMMNVLDNELGSANIIILALDGMTPRFTSGLQNMLRQVSSIFGDTWWDYMMIGVTKWEYSQYAIDQREKNCDKYGEDSEFCISEGKFIKTWTQAINEKFNLDKNFTFSFADAFSQSGNEDDDVQQFYWISETNKFWYEAIKRNESFTFKTIDDVLEENAACKAENERLKDIIDEEIANIKNDITNIWLNVSSNNKSIHNLESDVSSNSQSIEDLESDVEKLAEFPIGTILAWVNKVDDSGNYVDLPSGWVKCDGSTIPNESIWAGKNTPDLNNQMKFLRGAPDASVLTMEDDRVKDHTHHVVEPAHNHEVTDPEHNHGVNDPGHTHGYEDIYTRDNGRSTAGLAGRYFANPEKHYETTYLEKTGISLNVEKTGISLSDTTIGVSVKGVKEETIKDDNETRPKNMHVIYIIRVW